MSGGGGEQLWGAAKDGDAMKVTRLLSDRTDVNYAVGGGSIPHWVACLEGYSEIIKILFA